MVCCCCSVLLDRRASLQLIMAFTGILTTVLKFVITFWVESLQMPKAVYCHAQLERKKGPLSGWSGQDWLTQLGSGWRFYLPAELSPSGSQCQSIQPVWGLTILVLLLTAQTLRGQQECWQRAVLVSRCTKPKGSLIFPLNCYWE